MRSTYPVLDHPGPLAFAHRGGALEAPENSPSAFRRAARLGFRYLETDLRATSDGVVLAFHDATLDRVTDRRGRIQDRPWREVSRARIAGSEPIPTLEQVLEEHPTLRLNVDLKDLHVLDPFVRVVDRTRCHDRICVCSFGGRRLREARRRLGPRVATSLAPDEALRLAAAARRRRRYQPPPGVACAQVPERIGRVRVVDAVTVRAVHRAGLHVHVWTINEAAAMHRLLDLGVDGIMTDRPSVLRRVLEERGCWP